VRGDGCSSAPLDQFMVRIRLFLRQHREHAFIQPDNLKF